MYLRISFTEKIIVGIIIGLLIVLFGVHQTHSSIGGITVVHAKSQKSQASSGRQKKSQREESSEYEVEYVDVPAPASEQINPPIITTNNANAIIKRTAPKENAEPKKETIHNSDGTRLERMITLRQGVVTIVEDLYDSKDHKIRHSVFVREKDGQERFVTEEYDEDGTVIVMPFIMTDDGKFIQIINKQYGSDKKTRISYKNKEVVVQTPQGREVTIGVVGRKFFITSENVTAHTALSVIVDDRTGEVFIEGDINRNPLNLLPHQLQGVLARQKIYGKLTKIEIVEMDDGAIAYFSQKTQQKRFAGLFARDIISHIAIDVTTGNVLMTKKTLWAMIMDALSM